MRTFFVNIQLAVDHAKKLLFIVQCSFVVKTVRALNKTSLVKSCLVRIFLHAESRKYMRKQPRL